MNLDGPRGPQERDAGSVATATAAAISTTTTVAVSADVSGSSGLSKDGRNQKNNQKEDKSIVVLAHSRSLENFYDSHMTFFGAPTHRYAAPFGSMAFNERQIVGRKLVILGRGTAALLGPAEDRRDPVARAREKQTEAAWVFATAFRWISGQARLAGGQAP